MVAYRRCKEKIYAAVYKLAVAEGDVRERLSGAYWYLRQLSPEEIPDNLREEFVDIVQSLTRRGPELGPNGAIYNPAHVHTLSRMKNSTGRKIAERIVRLSRELG